MLRSVGAIDAAAFGRSARLSLNKRTERIELAQIRRHIADPDRSIAATATRMWVGMEGKRVFQQSLARHLASGLLFEERKRRPEKSCQPLPAGGCPEGKAAIF